MSRHPLLSYLLRSARAEDGASDAELLRRFAGDRDGTAFELLVRRHADAVWKVCRGVARQHADAEDAFQATFLALARRAGSVRGPTAAGFLHRVAVHAALKVRAAADRLPAPLPEDVAIPARGDQPDIAAVHEEVARLPDRYRLPILLCDLQGHTYAEAAATLGWSVGTVSGRLSRARVHLRDGLERRGIAGVVALSAGGSAPAALVRTTAAVGGSPSAAVASLTNGVLLAMRTANLKWAAATTALTFGLAGGTLWAVGTGDAPKPAARAPDPPPKVAAKPAPAPIAGTWATTVVEQSSIDGVPQPLKKWEEKLVIAADRIVKLDADEFVDEEMTYTLHPGGVPNAIDVSSPRRGPMEGTYRLDGDRLRVAFGRPGDRPTRVPDPPVGWCWDLTRAAAPAGVLRQRYPNDPGWFWMMPPQKPRPVSATESLVLTVETEPTGAMAVSLMSAHAIDGGSRTPSESRVVLLDADGKRHLPASGKGVSSVGGRDGVIVTHYRWQTDPAVLATGQVKLIGVEQRPRQGQGPVRSTPERAK